MRRENTEADAKRWLSPEEGLLRERGNGVTLELRFCLLNIVRNTPVRFVGSNSSFQKRRLKSDS